MSAVPEPRLKRVSYAVGGRHRGDPCPGARQPDRGGRPDSHRPAHSSHFAGLVEAIVYQQLAGAAARAIPWSSGRRAARRGGAGGPARRSQTRRSERSGLSANKARSLRDLATKGDSTGTVVLSPRGLSRQSDEEVIARLSTVRGSGPWTAQMFLMFRLRRPRRLPVGDFGVRQGYGLAWEVPMPTARELEPLGDTYRPYRTVVAWYCWRAVELYAAAPAGALTR